MVTVEVADMIPDGWKYWLTWLEIAARQGYPSDQDEIDVLREDAGRNLGFTRVVARRK